MLYYLYSIGTIFQHTNSQAGRQAGRQVETVNKNPLRIYCLLSLLVRVLHLFSIVAPHLLFRFCLFIFHNRRTAAVCLLPSLCIPHHHHLHHKQQQQRQRQQYWQQQQTFYLFFLIRNRCLKFVETLTIHRLSPPPPSPRRFHIIISGSTLAAAAAATSA